MRIGVAKEIKPDEYRVALTPAGALELCTADTRSLSRLGRVRGARSPTPRTSAWVLGSRDVAEVWGGWTCCSR